MSDTAYFVTSLARIILFYAYLVAIGILAALVSYVVLQNRSIAQEARRGLCTLKAERVARVKNTQAILDHANQPYNAQIIHALGRQLLLRSLDSAKADVTALDDVSC